MLNEREWDEAVVESTVAIDELFQEVMRDLAGDRLDLMLKRVKEQIETFNAQAEAQAAAQPPAAVPEQVPVQGGVANA
jgi:hypothetical protein